MKLKKKLIQSYVIIALFLSVALAVAYTMCDDICAMLPNMSHNTMTVFFGVSILALILALWMSVVFATRISDPLRLLNARTKEIAYGKYENIISYHTGILETDDLITSVNMLAKSLATQQNIKKQMAQNYAHEFRTPLAAIQVNLEGMMDGIFEPTNERIQSIQQEILRLTRMINEIDKIVDIENTNTSLKKEEFDIGQLLHNIAFSFEVEAKAKNIQLKVCAKPYMMVADKDKISQVIINLLSNALKYTEEGEIMITSKYKEDLISFSIADTGIGIEKEDLSNIFDYLYRVDKSRSRDTGGSGIGLTLVESIVAAHGGTVNVESQWGKGSKFTVTLKKN